MIFRYTTGSGDLAGIDFRVPNSERTVSHLDRFDVLEATVDHDTKGAEKAHQANKQLAWQETLVLHGVGTVTGTSLRSGGGYLDEVRADADSDPLNFSEQLAWTNVPWAGSGGSVSGPQTTKWEASIRVAKRSISDVA